jgi:hypothetical protein
MMYELITDKCCEINTRIAKEMNLDGVHSKYPFSCDGTKLYGISEKDIHLLSEDEQGKLTEQPILEEVI